MIGSWGMALERKRTTVPNIKSPKWTRQADVTGCFSACHKRPWHYAALLGAPLRRVPMVVLGTRHWTRPGAICILLTPVHVVLNRRSAKVPSHMELADAVPHYVT